MAENQIKSLRPHHDAILNYLLANPTAKMTEVASEFGVTPAWLSVVINSDVFQTKLRARQDEVFECTIAADIKDKLLGVAHLAVEKLSESLSYETDTKTISDATNMALKNLGFGQKVIGTQINLSQENKTQVNVSAEIIENARALVGKARQVMEEPPLELERQALPEDSAGGEGRVGQAGQSPALPDLSQDAEGEVPAGAEVRGKSPLEAFEAL